jgi:tRNA (guanine-N7-)-methyltransferase
MLEDSNSETQSKFMRKIVSFVRREGRLTNGQARAIEELWPTMGIDYSSEQKLDFSRLFGNDNPVVLEIGFGMGKSLVEMAAADRNTNFIGIEVHKPGVGACLMAARESLLTNLKVIEHDAVEVLESMIADSSLSKVQIFFPDPWQKKKHNKRRIIQPSFLELLAKKIRSQGLLHMATDWQQYAEHMLEVGNGSEYFVNTSLTNDYIPRPDFRPMTKFELRGISQGHGIWDLMFQRK